MNDIAAALMRESDGELMELLNRAMPPYAERLAFVGVVGAMTLRDISADDICLYTFKLQWPGLAFEGCEQEILDSLVYAMVDRGINGSEIDRLVAWICRGTTQLIECMRANGVDLK